MKRMSALLMLLSTSAFANLNLAPPDFNSSYGRAIFVDFTDAQYDITYDLENAETIVKTKITFIAAKEGKPIFDLVPGPSWVKLNGNKIKQRLIKVPGDVTKIRLADEVVSPGVHILETENRISSNVSYNDDGSRVSSAFWIRDLKERKFLEQYFPSNFEYDQYKMTFNIQFTGVKKISQDFYTNGVVSQLSPVSWKIEFPEYFTVSCPFFHTSPKGALPRIDFTYQSINGRQIPITVYSPWSSRTKRFKDEAIRVMQELEADYGPWAHPSLVAYGTMVGTGGMEHSGATATSFGALDHEMLHSYFAKGVMPANGNSGWIDEAIASWRDNGYQRNPTPGFDGSGLGNHSPYQRKTDNRAYGLGSAFMAYMDYRLQDAGGLKAFLKGYFGAYKHMVITTQHFKNNLEFFSGLNLDHEFNTLIWGENTENVENFTEENPHHAPLSVQELESIL